MHSSSPKRKMHKHVKGSVAGVEDIEPNVHVSTTRRKKPKFVEGNMVEKTHGAKKGKKKYGLEGVNEEMEPNLHSSTAIRKNSRPNEGVAKAIVMGMSPGVDKRKMKPSLEGGKEATKPKIKLM